MNVFERIKHLYENEGFNKHSFEQKMGFGNNSLGGGSTIRSDRLLAIAEYFNVSTDYLLTGKEYDAPVLSASEKQMLSLFRQLNIDGQRQALEQLDTLTASKKYNTAAEHNSVSREIA